MIKKNKNDIPNTRNFYCAASRIEKKKSFVVKQKPNTTLRDRARLSQEWVQGLMCIRAPILNRLNKLNIFDELKYIM